MHSITPLKDLPRNVQLALLVGEIHQYLLKLSDGLKDAFAQWMRNGVWGTCGDCPQLLIKNKGTAETILPELCVNFGEDNHRMDVNALISHYRTQARQLHSELTSVLSNEPCPDMNLPNSKRFHAAAMAHVWMEKYNIDVDGLLGLIKNIAKKD